MLRILKAERSPNKRGGASIGDVLLIETLGYTFFIYTLLRAYDTVRLIPKEGLVGSQLIIFFGMAMTKTFKEAFWQHTTQISLNIHRATVPAKCLIGSGGLLS